jgi:hypothetical protein
MTLLDNLFSKKAPAKAGSEKSAGHSHDDGFPSSNLSAASHSADRKSLRLERRELLYAVVRESMARVGMLSSSYKYKVLSLDPRGRQYLIMMDLPQEMVIEPNRLAEIEAVVTQNAKARHDIVVTAVYWRINEPSGTISRKPKAMRANDVQQPLHTPESAEMQVPSPVESQSPARPAGRYEPIRDDEVAAFKQALATGIPGEPSPPKEKSIKSWKHKPVPRADFADTELEEQAAPSKKWSRQTIPRPRDFADTEVAKNGDKISPLSGTQYGDLI